MVTNSEHSQETNICTKIVQYVATLEPINKAFIVSLLGSGTGRTRRLARWVAHGVITDVRVIDPVRDIDRVYLFSRTDLDVEIL